MTVQELEANLISDGFNLLRIIIHYLSNVFNLLRHFLQRPIVRKLISHICSQLLCDLGYILHDLYTALSTTPTVSSETTIRP
jgi:hypothetical protein